MTLKETHLLFKAAFDRINTGLQAKLPKLFDSGHALRVLVKMSKTCSFYLFHTIKSQWK